MKQKITRSKIKKLNSYEEDFGCNVVGSSSCMDNEQLWWENAAGAF
jgi:hypothetical protein